MYFVPGNASSTHSSSERVGLPYDESVEETGFGPKQGCVSSGLENVLTKLSLNLLALFETQNICLLLTHMVSGGEQMFWR